jgi:hypothetical protein
MHESEMVVALTGMACVFGLPIMWVVCHYSFLAWKQWHATALVRDMIARGYTAQEIIQMFQVLGHRPSRHLKVTTDVPPAKPIRQPVYSP